LGYSWNLAAWGWYNTKYGVYLSFPQSGVSLWLRLRAWIKMFYVYFAESDKNGKVYVGMTAKDPANRLREHNEGTNAWSRSNSPLRLIYYEKYYCKKDAAEREKFFKMGMGKKIKKAIVEVINKS